MNKKYFGIGLITVAALVPSLAFAGETEIDADIDNTEVKASVTAEDDDDNDDDDGRLFNDPDPNKRYRVGAGQPSESLPPARSDDDPQPPVAAPSVPSGGVVKQAGTGGQTAYGRSGVLELGGAANFTKATDFTQVALNPSIGWFFMDNVEASAILGLTHLDAGGASQTFFSFLLEPSLHIPFSQTVFGLVGAGVGPSWSDATGLGLAFAPRLGIQVLLGRSGILTPSVSWQYTTHDTADVAGMGTLLVVSSSVRANVGYTIMW